MKRYCFCALLAALFCMSAFAADKPTKYNLDRKRLTDGPYVLYTAGLPETVTTDSHGEVLRGPYRGGPLTVLSSQGKRLFDVELHEIARGPWELPQAEKLFVTSDPHGDFESFATLLQAHGVIDRNYRWSYGPNQLVVIGDIFDRGYDVLPLFWLMYKLEAEAAEAGGAAIFLLGNHEPMVTAGDVRYTRGKYLNVAEKLGMENYRELFSPETELGRWLQTRNTMLRIGRNLFVHAGLSMQLFDRGIPVPELNEAMSEGLYMTSKERKAHGEQTEFLFRSWGPVWYRGMVQQQEAKYEPPTQAQTETMLAHYDADRLLVGHTIFPDITTFYEGRLIAVNVQNDLNRRKNLGRAVLIEGEHISVVGNKKVKRVLQE